MALSVPHRAGSDKPSPTAWQKAVSMAGLIAWFGVAITTVIFVTAPSNDWLQQARSGTAVPSLWFRPDGWVRSGFMAPAIVGGIVTILDIRLINKLTALSVLFAVLVMASAVSTRGYTVVMNDQVLTHPALPWHHDSRFALDRATVTAKGCRLWHSKSATHRQIVFQVRTDAGGGQTVDLGEAAGRDIGAWLAVMRDYDTGQLSLPAAAGAQAPHDAACLDYWLGRLDARQQAELTHLLS